MQITRQEKPDPYRHRDPALLHIVIKKGIDLMNQKTPGRILLAILLLALFTVLGTDYLKELSHYNTLQKKTIEDEEYRREFFCDAMRKHEGLLSEACRKMLSNVENEVTYFPIPESTVDKSLKVSYVDSWMGERKYKGTSGHEGTDIMALKNERGVYPVLSMTDGTITNLGWLEKGGYRIGVTADSGTYYYYAHLDSYANIQKGDRVKAGQLLGYMGDTGYGEEGTKGKFDVHLHVGIYSYEEGREVSVNPYYVLLYLENKKLKYAYS